MARQFIVVNQSDYVSLGGELGAYGIHKDFLNFTVENVSTFSANRLNQLAPMIHLNKNHVTEEGEPAGEAKVMSVAWVEPDARNRGVYPTVRLRELPFGAVGTSKTLRKRYTAAELRARL